MRSLKYITRHTIPSSRILSKKISVFQYTYERLSIANFDKDRIFQIRKIDGFKTTTTTIHNKNNVETHHYISPYDITANLNYVYLKSKKRKNRTNLIELDRRRKVVNLSKRANNTFW